jgi:hypothetical protein
MPERKKLADSVTQAGKEVLATDAAQTVVATIADRMQEMAQAKPRTHPRSSRRRRRRPRDASRQVPIPLPRWGRPDWLKIIEGVDGDRRPRDLRPRNPRSRNWPSDRPARRTSVRKGEGEEIIRSLDDCEETSRSKVLKQAAASRAFLGGRTRRLRLLGSDREVIGEIQGAAT